MTALWFAVENSPNQKRTVKENGVLWIFTPDEEDRERNDNETSPFSLKKTKIIRPNHTTSRITAQNGWFTVHMFKEKANKFIPLNTNKLYKAKLKKYIIPHECFSDIRKSLDICDIDGLSRYINWKHSYLDDELKIEPKLIINLESKSS